MIGKNMMLISSAFRNAKSYSLVPVAQDCPYVEAMYDPSSSILAVITKTKKDSFHMVPRLDENGQPMRLKAPSPETGKVIKEQRVTVETFSEFYITEKEEIDNFIKIFAINSDSFDYGSMMVDTSKIETSKIIV